MTIDLSRVQRKPAVCQSSNDISRPTYNEMDQAARGVNIEGFENSPPRTGNRMERGQTIEGNTGLRKREEYSVESKKAGYARRRAGNRTRVKINFRTGEHIATSTLPCSRKCIEAGSSGGGPAFTSRCYSPRNAIVEKSWQKRIDWLHPRQSGGTVRLGY